MGVNKPWLTLPIVNSVCFIFRKILDYFSFFVRRTDFSYANLLFFVLNFYIIFCSKSLFYFIYTGSGIQGMTTAAISYKIQPCDTISSEITNCNIFRFKL